MGGLWHAKINNFLEWVLLPVILVFKLLLRAIATILSPIIPLFRRQKAGIPQKHQSNPHKG